jgi:alginate O-acetyltransferase complex protein AlgJ
MKSEDCASEQRGLRGLRRLAFSDRRFQPPGQVYDRNAPRLPDAKLRNWVKLIEARAARLERRGIQYVHLVIPEKLSVYDNKLREPIVDWKLSPALRLGEMLQHSQYRNVWLDLVQPFRAARDQTQLYLKTDSHWNSEGGCFFAYQLLCDHIQRSPIRTCCRGTMSIFVAICIWAGRSIRQSPNPFDSTTLRRTLRWYRNPIAEYLETVNSEPLLHRGAHVAFGNSAPTAAQKKILIFGDSSASQRPDLLTGMLAETVAEVEFIWSSNFDWHYIRRMKPDLVVYDMAERFLTKLPRDRLNLRMRLWLQGNAAKWLITRARKRETAQAGS